MLQKLPAIRVNAPNNNGGHYIQWDALAQINFGDFVSYEKQINICKEN